MLREPRPPRKGGGWGVAFGLGVLIIVAGIAFAPALAESVVYVVFLGILFILGSLLWRSAAGSPLRGVPLDDPRMAHVRRLSDRLEEREQRDRQRAWQPSGSRADGAEGVGAILDIAEAVIEDVNAEHEARRKGPPTS